MSGDEQKLISDHKEVTGIIKQYEKIKLINTAGDPVNEYDLEYKIKGYSLGADGNVRVNKSHRIKIKLPFGYPHFHPTVKPLSKIFHPDIEDHAVRIAHQWEQNQSLGDLVAHIGEMICGKYYTTESPFNTKAAEYYAKHEKNFPLDTIENPKKEETKKAQKEPMQLDFLAPLMKILLFIVIAALLGAGGFYYFEKSKLKDTEKVFQKAQSYAQEQEYKLAESVAQQALMEIEGYLLLKSASEELQRDINEFLQTDELQQGLLGKIKFGDEYLEIERVHKLEVLHQKKEKARQFAELGDTQKALEEYENALEYAIVNDLQRGIAAVQVDLADLKLAELVAASKKAHESKDWDWAIRRHRMVIDYINKEKQYLNNAEKQLAETQYLLLIDQIALHSKLGLEAEQDNDLETALVHYSTLIDLINKSTSKDEAALKTTLADARQKAAILSEKVNIKRQREWLIANYKEIFQVHYPASIPKALRSPQAKFVKYSGKNMVYDLSCLEKSGATLIRLRIHYQYNPQNRQWSVFDGEI